MKDNKKTGLNVAAFVCGIMSIITCAFYYLALPTGILAIVLGAKGAKTGSKLGKTGIILGIIGLSLFVIIYGLLISGVVLYA